MEYTERISFLLDQAHAIALAAMLDNTEDVAAPLALHTIATAIADMDDLTQRIADGTI
jgi:hypothetical protein